MSVCENLWYSAFLVQLRLTADGINGAMYLDYFRRLLPLAFCKTRQQVFRMAEHKMTPLFPAMAFAAVCPAAHGCIKGLLNVKLALILDQKESKVPSDRRNQDDHKYSHTYHDHDLLLQERMAYNIPYQITYIFPAFLHVVFRFRHVELYPVNQLTLVPVCGTASEQGMDRKGREQYRREYPSEARVKLKRKNLDSLNSTTLSRLPVLTQLFGGLTNRTGDARKRHMRSIETSRQYWDWETSIHSELVNIKKTGSKLVHCRDKSPFIFLIKRARASLLRRRQSNRVLFARAPTSRRRHTGTRRETRQGVERERGVRGYLKRFYAKPRDIDSSCLRLTHEAC
uniref:Uncharacterized protein n=1 Tax=Timema shepardi TaxID=629360 RepID=A0A7R9AW57_TIMSH|nr:unnamed protein product [Timema shepardi]